MAIVTIGGHHDGPPASKNMAQNSSAPPLENDGTNHSCYQPPGVQCARPADYSTLFNPRLIKESFALIESVADKAMTYFYGRLFSDNPGLRGMFPASAHGQGERLLQAMRRIVASLDSPHAAGAYLATLGREHRKYGVAAEHYAAVGDAFIATLARFAGNAWTNEVHAAWQAALDLISKIMISAAEQDAIHAPPWWLGEVVAHERRGPDVAVLAVAPNQPLPHRAGQYLTVQCARWPRVWRRYSIANAPRADGLLRLHVRAVPGGWVSGTLVHHTAPGDVLVLGPAAGAMIADTGASRDVVCAAGGTGLAPLKAIVQHLLARERSGAKRRIHLLFGARRESDLYDLLSLRRMESRHPSLRVIPVISEEPGFDGMRGMLPDAMAQYLPLVSHDVTNHDVYVAGPAEMVRATARVLSAMGVPAARIHNDPIGTEF